MTYFKVNEHNRDIFRLSNTKFANRRHVVKWDSAARRAKRDMDIFADGYYDAPTWVDLAFWKIFGGSKPRVRRTYKFIHAGFYIWFSNDSYPYFVKFHSNEAAVAGHSEFCDYMAEMKESKLANEPIPPGIKTDFFLC